MSDTHGVARDQLRAFVERIERLEEEKKTITDDIRDVYGEAKSMGFDTKILKQVIALRKKDDQERTEEEIVRDMYLAALGMIPDFEADRGVAPVARTQTKSPPMALQSPRKAAEAVSERAAAFQAKASDEACETGPCEGRAEASANASDGVELVSRVVDGRTSTATSERMDVTDRRDDHLNSPSDDDAFAAVKGKARLANVADVDPSSSAPNDPDEDRREGHSLGGELSAVGANTGGGHVDDTKHAATQKAEALVDKSVSATFNLRPHCLRRDSCAGHGTKHCHACTVAMREGELA